MKKILFAIALVFAFSVAANAQKDVFFKWNGSGIDYDAPLGNGLLVLTALGAGYALVKRRK